MRHPSYAIVVAEIFVLPMAFGLHVYAAVFSLLNAGILAVRIHAENCALQSVASSSVDGAARYDPGNATGK